MPGLVLRRNDGLAPGFDLFRIKTFAAAIFGKLRFVERSGLDDPGKFGLGRPALTGAIGFGTGRPVWRNCLRQLYKVGFEIPSCLDCELTVGGWGESILFRMVSLRAISMRDIVEFRPPVVVKIPNRQLTNCADTGASICQYAGNFGYTSRSEQFFLGRQPCKAVSSDRHLRSARQIIIFGKHLLKRINK